MTTHSDVAHLDPAPGGDDPEGTLVRRIEGAVEWLAQSTAVVSRFYRSRAEIAEVRYEQARLDRVLVTWWLALVVCYTVAYLQVPYVWLVAVALSVLRIVNVTFWNLRIALVATGKSSEGVALHRVTSIKRSLRTGVSISVVVVRDGAVVPFWQQGVELNGHGLFELAGDQDFQARKIVFPPCFMRYLVRGYSSELLEDQENSRNPGKI